MPDREDMDIKEEEDKEEPGEFKQRVRFKVLE